MKKILTLSSILFTCFVMHAQDEVKKFDKVETEASFPGGDKAWLSYITKFIDGSIPDEHHAPHGAYTVVIQFIVDKDGTISDLKPLTSHGYGMEEEVMRVIAKGPKWIPATQNGKIVRAYRKQPVTFQVSKDFELSSYTFTAGQPKTVELKMFSQDVDHDELQVTITKGTIKRETGNKYTITADAPGRILLSVKINARKKRDQRDYGTVALTVK